MVNQCAFPHPTGRRGRPGQLFAAPADCKKRGISERIKRGKAEFSPCISGFSSADFPAQPAALSGARAELSK